MSAETLRAIRRRTYAARDRVDKKAHACAHRGADLYGNCAGLTKQERNPFIAILARDVDSSADITHGSNGAYSPCVPRAHRCLQTMDRGRLTPTSLQRGRRQRTEIVMPRRAKPSWQCQMRTREPRRPRRSREETRPPAWPNQVLLQ